jgi:predicted RND superfamily exporter protein
MNIQQLCDRYSLKTRQSIYDWAKALDIKLAKDDSNKSYATPEMIEKFDELSEHLKEGGTLKNFTPLVKTTVNQPLDTVNYPLDTTLDTVNHELDTLTEPSYNSDLVEMVTAIASILKPQSVLSHHRELEEAAREGWVLSSAELTALGFRPVCKSGEDFCDRGCWRFIKAGKLGRGQGWLVDKISKGGAICLMPNT